MIAVSFSIIVFSIVVAILIRILTGLTQNYLRVRHLGIPVAFTPFGRRNPFWILTQPYLQPTFRKLSSIGGPFSIFNFIDHSANSCFFLSRYILHQRYGPAFWIISPGSIQLVIADALAAEAIQIRRKDFVKNESMYRPLNMFGPNVVTSNGETWAPHRRITTPPFNERNSSLVWKESLLQAEAILKFWAGKSEVANTPEDTMELALNVLMAAGFGKRFEFRGGAGEGEGHAAMVSYRSALSKLLGHMYKAVMTSMIIKLPLWAVPKQITEMKSVLNEVETFLRKMVEDERAGLHEKSQERDNLMSALLRASDVEASGKGNLGLTDEEIVGNLFIYNLAGHDTTSNTLAYAVTLLSTDLSVQEWLREEIRSVFGHEENVEKWTYEEGFPKLKRCLALMFETLRLYGPVFFFPRDTAESYQPLTINGKEVLIPPHVHLIVNSATLHTSSYWGKDASTWRPGRWLDSNEEFIEPPPGMFNPWIHGPRMCPGKKFAQVEFVAVIARLLKNGVVKPKLLKGEKREDAIVRVKGVMEDSELSVTLHMKHPEKAPLVWEILV